MKAQFHYHYHQYHWISDNTAKLLAFAQEHVACNTATCSNMKIRAMKNYSCRMEGSLKLLMR